MFNEKNRAILPFVAACCLFEFLKTILNTLANDNLLRLYLADFQCTYSNLQSIFDVACGISYFLVLRAILCMYANGDNPNYLKWMAFLKAGDEDELTGKFVINRREAASFLNIISALIRLAKINVRLFFVFQVLLHSRTLFAAYSRLPLSAFLFSTIPSALSFYVVNVACYQVSFLCFFVV